MVVSEGPAVAEFPATGPQTVDWKYSPPELATDTQGKENSVILTPIMDSIALTSRKREAGPLNFGCTSPRSRRYGLVVGDDVPNVAGASSRPIGDAALRYHQELTKLLRAGA